MGSKRICLEVHEPVLAADAALAGMGLVPVGTGQVRVDALLPRSLGDKDDAGRVRHIAPIMPIGSPKGCEGP